MATAPDKDLEGTGKVYDPIDPPIGDHGPYHDIIHDREFEGLTLYEKKALLVNRELDSHGMGRYQWWIFFLCGYGYLIDLMWAEAFGLIAPSLENELGFPGISLAERFQRAYGSDGGASKSIWKPLLGLSCRPHGRGNSMPVNVG